jgi:hypothetical protein
MSHSLRKLKLKRRKKRIKSAIVERRRKDSAAGEKQGNN